MIIIVIIIIIIFITVIYVSQDKVSGKFFKYNPEHGLQC